MLLATMNDKVSSRKLAGKVSVYARRLAAAIALGLGIDATNRLTSFDFEKAD